LATQISENLLSIVHHISKKHTLSREVQNINDSLHFAYWKKILKNERIAHQCEDDLEEHTYIISVQTKLHFKRKGPIFNFL